MEKLKAWFQQPTSVAGLAAIFGTILALLSHQITSRQAMPLFSAAFASIILRDNSAFPKSCVPSSPSLVGKVTEDQGKV